LDQRAVSEISTIGHAQDGTCDVSAHVLGETSENRTSGGRSRANETIDAADAPFKSFLLFVKQPLFEQSTVDLQKTIVKKPVKPRRQPF
jgi:hypothetical protein